ncbi:hypothetical protein FOCG_14431 [Fusarium oxysporum f. sp. radicis-lycopersici 26381]|nr:hypothetical protein FOCG_14431 [Fusarium oxysporum f. sp. radicis-lycopersici 26381]
MEAILLQLGIGLNAQDEESRGILKLEIGSFMDRDVPVIYRPFYDVLDTGFMWGMDPGLFDLPEQTHHEHNLVFRDAIEQTGDLALAIQAVLTRPFKMTYYYLMDEYNVAVPITTTHAVTMLIPVRWLGLKLVIILVAVHLFLMFLIICLFSKWTRVSALGNAWQAVAHAAFKTTDFELVDTALDKEVENWTKVTGRDSEIFILSRTADGDKIKFSCRNRGTMGETLP